MPIKLQSSSGGSVTLDVPVTASNFNVTVPNASGTAMVSGAMPAFRAYPSTNQTINQNTLTKVLFGSEIFDTNSNFASSTFTPTVAGYYQQNYNIAFNNTDGRQYYFLVQIYKNGDSLYNYEWTNTGNAGARDTINFGELIYLNGTADYLEVYFYIYDYSGSGSVTVRQNSSWSGYLARAA